MYSPSALCGTLDIVYISNDFFLFLWDTKTKDEKAEKPVNNHCNQLHTDVLTTGRGTAIPLTTGRVKQGASIRQ